MENLDNKIEKILQNEVSDRHSFFQLKYFVVGKEPTIQSKLWRCIRELKARKESIDSIRLEIDQTKDNKQLVEIKKQKQTTLSEDRRFGDLEREEYIINIRMIDRQIASYNKTIGQLEKKLESAEQEAAFFVACFEELEKVEKLIPWDDEDAQTEYWSQKFTQDLNLKMLLRQPLDTELVKTILSMKDGIPIKVQTQQLLDRVKEIDGQPVKAKWSLKE